MRTRGIPLTGANSNGRCAYAGPKPPSQEGFGTAVAPAVQIIFLAVLQFRLLELQRSRAFQDVTISLEQGGDLLPAFEPIRYTFKGQDFHTS